MHVLGTWAVKPQALAPGTNVPQHVEHGMLELHSGMWGHDGTCGFSKLSTLLNPLNLVALLQGPAKPSRGDGSARVKKLIAREPRGVSKLEAPTKKKSCKHQTILTGTHTWGPIHGDPIPPYGLPPV